jgi:NADH-quinone oxidoreductase subunit G
VLKRIPGTDSAQVPADRLSNETGAPLVLPASAGSAVPVVASIYQLDSLVRRATSLQLTADARAVMTAEEVAA